jgi:hypothetical protein
MKHKGEFIHSKAAEARHHQFIRLFFLNTSAALSFKCICGTGDADCVSPTAGAWVVVARQKEEKVR